MKYSKTEAGQQAFKQRSPNFSARQRSMFILFDGQKTVGQVLATTSGMGTTPDDVQALVEWGYLEAPQGGSAPPGTDGEGGGTTAPALSDQERFLQGSALATKITAALGLRGFRLNMSVEQAGNLDDLIALLPKIQEAAGKAECKELAALLGR